MPDTSSTSGPGAFPSVLQRKKNSHVQSMEPHEQTSKPLIWQECSKCGAKEMWYSSKQLRGADEGTTIFFECPVCGNKWVVKNLRYVTSTNIILLTGSPRITELNLFSRPTSFSSSPLTLLLPRGPTFL